MPDITEIFDTRVSLEQYWEAAGETAYMVGVSLFIGALIGIPVGVALVLTRRGGLMPHQGFFAVLNFVVNIIRSVPFIILMVAIVPFTRIVTGSSIGTTAALVPLTLYIAPFIARVVETALLDVDEGILEAAKAMGATLPQTIWHFLLPEAKSSIYLALTTATVGLIGATAMAGTIGGGGVGDLASTLR